jgi:hypothetical protein
MRDFSESELKLIEASGVSAEKVSAFMDMFPQNLDTAIGQLVGLEAGRGQERNEPFVPAAPVEVAPVEETPVEEVVPEVSVDPTSGTETAL